MKEFTTFSKEDQRLICEVRRLQNEAAISALTGKIVDNSAEFEACVKNMSYEARLYMIELLENSLPEEYRTRSSNEDPK